jgi:glucose/arabinose dehydrogenase
MDIRFHPQQSKNGWIYWSSTVGDSKAQTTRISRAKLIDTRLTEIETVFEARPLVHSGYHFGSRITWDSERALYITLGERNERHRAQKKDEHWGKVVRIDDTGAVTIYTYGHRNPQGIAYDSMSGELFVSEHGPKGGDELNRLVLGANYGWPTLTAGREYWGAKIAATNSAPGFESPLLTWVPSIAPGSLHFFSDRAHSSLRGKLGAGALKEQHLNVVAISRDSRTRRIVGLREEQRLWATLKQRIRALAEAPNGDVYFGTDSGELYRFSTDFELNPPASPKTTR